MSNQEIQLFFCLDSNAVRITARSLHYSKPAMQVMATNPLRAKEATVRMKETFFFSIFNFFLGTYR